MNGFHLDLKWSMPTRAYLKDILRKAYEFGFDTILLEFEDKIFFDFLGPAVSSQCWKKEELEWFLGLAKKYNMEVIPKVALMGHMEWILQWPWWSHMQENRDRTEICPLHPESKTFIMRLLEEVLELFAGSRMIHLGGDETGSLGTCDRCKASGKNRGKLYLDHYLPLIEQVEKCGKRALLYCDMVLAYPKTLTKLPRSVIVCDWDYWSGTKGKRYLWGIAKDVTKVSQLPKLTKPFHGLDKYLIDNNCFVEFPYSSYLKDKGFDVITMSAARSYGDNYCAGRSIHHIKNAICGAQRARDLNLVGTIVTSWAVRFNHFETTWPALAASSWAYSNIIDSVESVSEKFAKEFWGCDWPDFLSDIDLLSHVFPDLHAIHAWPYHPGIVHNYIRYLYEDVGSQECRRAEKVLDVAKDSFEKGLRILNRQKKHIKKNCYAYDIWLLAAETLVHKAKALPIIMKLSQGKFVPRKLADRLYQQVLELAQRHKRVFAKSFKRASCELEIDIRFKEEQEILEGRILK